MTSTSPADRRPRGAGPAFVRPFLPPWVAITILALVGLGGCTATSSDPSTAPASSPPPPAATAETEADPSAVRPELWPRLEAPQPLDPEVEASVDALLARMTLDEKVGQVIQAEIRHTTPDDARKYDLGSVLNGGGSHPGGDREATPQAWLDLADAYWDASTDTSDGGVGIPLLWGVDAVHGHNNVIGATLFPHNVGLGATRDAELVEAIGRATAKEIIVTGLDWNFSPTVAVARDLRWGRAYESYSQDPALVAELGAALVRGVQGELGDSWLGDEHTLTTAKHFLGDGGTHAGIDQGDTRVDEEELRDVHGAGYVTALEAGVQAVMASFSSWHGRKLHGHGGLLTEVLKGRMGFDGFVVGDWNGHGQVAGCSNQSCAASFLAGVDMFMVPEDWKALYDATKAQVESGEIPMERLDDAVRRILRVKHRYGHFDRERRGVRPSARPLAGDTSILGSPEHRDIARRAVRQSLVLLKNEAVDRRPGEDGRGGSEPVLPIRPGRSVLITGSGADDIGQQAGGWTISWQGTGNSNDDFPGATSIGRGLEQAIVEAGGRAVLADGYDPKSPPDVAIVVYGETPYAEFQGDRLTVQYAPESDPDLELLRSLRAAGVPTVSVFLSGRPLWVNPHLNASDAFVAAWLPGSEGAGVADVLVAGADGSVRHDFTGRLSFAWPATVLDALPAEIDAPLFPLGFGLSYDDDGTLAELSEEVAADASVSASHVYFRGGPIAPWRLETEGAVEVSPVDRRVQEDARRIVWSGPGTVALRSGTGVGTGAGGETVDLRREANGGLSLAFDVQVEQAPEGSVHLALVGTTGGPGVVSLDEILASSGEAGLETDDGWRRIRISLRCLAEAGGDVARVHTPWALRADAPTVLRVSDVSLDTAGDGEAVCPPSHEPEEATP